MIFEITIIDTNGRPLMQDAFLMESITTLTDFSFGMLKPSKRSSEEQAFELAIVSEKDCHVSHRFASLKAVMVFKNALYDHLIELSETPPPSIKKANNFKHLANLKK